MSPTTSFVLAFVLLAAVIWFLRSLRRRELRDDEVQEVKARRKAFSERIGSPLELFTVGLVVFLCWVFGAFDDWNDGKTTVLFVMVTILMPIAVILAIVLAIGSGVKKHFSSKDDD